MATPTEDLAIRMAQEFNTLRANELGDRTQLLTTAKNTLVAAINEIYSMGGGGGGGAAINDGIIGTTTTWSSSKINTEITTRVAAVTPASLGLGNVENKSSATIRSEITASNVNTALGFAPLDSAAVGATVAPLSGGTVPAIYLPAYVDDVLEYPTVADLPPTGEVGKIYVITTGVDIDKQYRWSGSAYRQIVASPGSTDAVPEGAANLYFTEARVRGTDLAGINTALTTAVTAADDVLGAFGKAQGQINATNVRIDTLTPASVGLGNVENFSKDQIRYDVAERSGVLYTDWGLAPGALVERRSGWNDSVGTLQLGLKGGNVTMNVGQEILTRVVNKTGATLSKATTVYINGSQGNRPTVAPARSDAEATSITTLGMVSEDIPNNAEGYVTTFGVLRGVNTGATPENTFLYLSATSAGTTTTTPPVTPNRYITVGVVLNQHATQGEIFVKVTQTGRLVNLNDVLANTPADGEVLTFEQASNLWKSKPSAGGAGTVMSVNGKLPDGAGAVTLVKGDIGLTNVEDKSSATIRGEITSGNVTGALGFTPMDSTAAGVTVAQLVAGKVPSAQLPSYVDDVEEYANLAAFPGTGETGKIYIAIDTNKQYRWTGSAYQEMVSSPGTTDAVVEGSTNLYFTETRVRATVLTGLSLAINAVIAATDTVLSAMGKLQKQISDFVVQKDASGGLVGMTLFKINFRNAANTLTSFLQNSNTSARTYTFPDYDGNVATQHLEQNSQSAAYTCTLADANKQIYHPSADATARTWTIPANASVPFKIGDSITFINDTGAGVITIAITTDTLKMAGTGSTGSRSLAAGGMATAVKITATSWMINGAGLA